MAEKIIAEYQLDTTKFRQQVNGIVKSLDEVEKEGKQAGNETAKSFDKAGQSAVRFSKQVSDSGSQIESLKSTITNFAGAVGVAFGVQQVIEFTKSTITAASDLNETFTKVDQLFGSSTDTVKAWSETTAQSLGQSQQQALDAASTFAIFGKSAGLTGEDLVKFSTDFTGLASDLASFNNTTPEEAIQAIGAALRGENEPIRRYGVLLDEASLKQAALKEGIITSTKEALTPQQKVLAAQLAIYQQTTAAQGDFARTSDGLANQQRILAAQFEDTKTKLGQALLPSVLSVVQALNQVKPESFVALFKTIAVGIGTFVTVTAVTKAASIATSAYKTVSLALAGAKAVLSGNTMRAAAAQRALGLSFAATPWGFIITAITTVASGLLFMSQNTDDAANSQNGLGEELDENQKKLEEQAKRVALINGAWEKFSGNKAALSVSDLKQAIQEINTELENIPEAAEAQIKSVTNTQQVYDEVLGRWVTTSNIVAETQAEANTRQAEYVTGLKAKKKALEDQLAAQENNNNNHKKEITLLQQVQKEVTGITDRITKQILTGGPISQKDIDRLEFLNGKLDNLKLRLDEIKKQTSGNPIELELEGFDNKQVEALLGVFLPAYRTMSAEAERENQRMEESMKRAKNQSDSLAAEFAKTEELRKQIFDEYNLYYDQEGDVRQQNFDTELEERRQKLLEAYNQGIIDYEAYQMALNQVDSQYSQKRLETAFTVADGILSAFSSVFSALAQDNEEFAKFQKALAIVDVSLKAAQAIAAATAAAASGDPYTVAIRIAAAVAAVGAAIGTIVQTVKSSEVPSAPAFAKGTDFVQRGNNRAGVDTIPAYLNEGEAVIPTDKNKAYPGLAKAWIGGSLDDYIVRNFVAPKLVEIERKAEDKWMNSFVSKLNGDGFDDARLLLATSEGNMYLKSIAREMKNKPKKRTIQ